jgi:hypothetical protein
VCDWIVTVKVRGTRVVSVTCRSKKKRKWKTLDKAAPRTTTIKIPTIVIIIIIIIIIKRMKIIDTDNRGKKIRIIFNFIKTAEVKSV